MVNVPSQKSVEELLKIFMQSHKEWEEINNPTGLASGEAQKRWDKRIANLLSLVRAKEQKNED